MISMRVQDTYITPNHERPSVPGGGAQTGLPLLVRTVQMLALEERPVPSQSTLHWPSL
jgi:hypothetical protein